MAKYLLMFIGVSAGILLGIYSNFIYDFLRERGFFKKHPSQKFIIISAVFISLVITVILTQAYEPKIPPRDWEKIFNVDENWGHTECGWLQVMYPENIDPKVNPDEAYNFMSDFDLAFGSRQILPEPNPYQERKQSSLGWFITEITLNNKTKANDWPYITNKVSAIITFKPFTDDANGFPLALMCGGGIKRNHFDTIPLYYSNMPYEIVTISEDYDKALIQPGETVFLLFAFRCQASGVYNIELKLPYSYADTMNSIHLFSNREFVCPKSVKLWGETNEDSVKLKEEYYWDDSSSEYIAKMKQK